jgi:hypothetical protein
MIPNTFQVTLSDEQLAAAKTATASYGVNLGPAGSLSRDGVTVNYTIEAGSSEAEKAKSKPPAGSNLVTVTILYRPLYVPADQVQSLITDFLTNPPAAPGIESGNQAEAKAVAAAEATPAESEPHLVEASARRHTGRKE